MSGRAAQSVIDYVQAAQGTETRRIEETPFGMVITRELTPNQAWARHLAQRLRCPRRRSLKMRLRSRPSCRINRSICRSSPPSRSRLKAASASRHLDLSFADLMDWSA